MTNEIFTIGYSGFTIENFIKTLKKFSVNCLVDVRSVPKSVYYTDYDEKNLSRVLKKNNVIYRNYAEEFGARQTDENFFTDGVLDFEKFSASVQFNEGIKKILSGMKLDYKFVLMCAEKKPETCHRNILVARKFHELGYTVKNILADGNFMTQDEIEKILLDKYFSDRNQMSLFENISDSEMIRQSYRKQNFAIGYKLEENDFEENFHGGIH